MKKHTACIYCLPTFLCIAFSLGACIPSTRTPLVVTKNTPSVVLPTLKPNVNTEPTPTPTAVTPQVIPGQTPIILETPLTPTTPIPNPSPSQNANTSSGSSGGSSGGSGGSGQSGTVVTSSFQITDVRLVSTGQSISAQKNSEALDPIFNSPHEVELALIGNFTQPTLSLGDFTFTQVPGLLHLSVGKDELPYRITLGESLLLTPISISPHEIRVRLNTEGLSDLFLNGNQALRITANSSVTSHLIRVQATGTQSSLLPQIQSIELIDTTVPPQLKITGKNFPLQPHLSHVSIDEQTLHPLQTAIKEVDGELIWEHWASFNTNTPPEGDFSVFYSSPFGVSFYTFSQGSEP